MRALPPPPGPHRLPDTVAAVLRSVRDAERTATGRERRSAFRMTRVLLGGVRAAGYPVALLADCLGMSVTAARDRSGIDGWIGDLDLSAVAGVSD